MNFLNQLSQDHYVQIIQRERTKPTVRGHLAILAALRKAGKDYNSIQRSSLPPDTEKAVLALNKEFRARLRELRETTKGSK